MLTVIAGSMFSEKSDHVIDEFEKRYHKEKIMVFKPGEDTRDEGVVRSRGRFSSGKMTEPREIPAIIISDISEILGHLVQKTHEKKDISTILIDEGNFLKGDPTILRDLSLYADIDVIVAGLNQDRFQNPFGLMPQIMSLADQIIFTNASCNDCNRPAVHTIMDDGKNDSKEQILVGDKADGFMAICPRCLARKKSKELEKPIGLSLVLKVRENIDGSKK